MLKLLKRQKVVYDVHEHNNVTILTREWLPRLPCGASPLPW